MPTEEKPTPEREQTDESLRVERETADDLMNGKHAALDEIADAVIEKARARADNVLALGRAKIDRQSATHSPGAESAGTLESDRGREDRALQEERAAADATVRTERGEPAALLATERDATDKNLSHERSQSNHVIATRDEFLRIVSHDLKNMLSGMIAVAEVMSRVESGEAEHQPEQMLMRVKRIQRSGARMNRLIGDLVDVGSIEAGTLAVRRQVDDASRVVTEAVETLQTQAAAGGVSLLAEIGSASLHASFDAARILQVLVNLVSNAIKFTPPNGKVVVSVERIGDELQFAVRDTGAGIPADRLGDVFEPYRQSKDDRRGVGLGLYISRCIVQGHGGRIWVESRLCEGSTFRFTLPIDEGAGARANVEGSRLD